MRTVTTLAQRENQNLANIAADSRKDSKVMKAFSVVATLYLPASLIAVSVLELLSWLARTNSGADYLQFQSHPSTTR
jgi:hypothetical protein